MDAHTHTHTDDPDMHRSRKKFIHYLWEFLMLFLAVFCGFLAENFREHQVEHQREKEFMHSLVKDLMLDTAYLNICNNINLTKVLSIDTVLKNFKNDPGLKELSPELFRAYNQAVAARLFVHHSGTINQLQNSGGMRMIRKTEIVDSIEAYYQQVARMQLQNISWNQYQEEYRNLRTKVLNSADRLKRLNLTDNVEDNLKLNNNSMNDRTPVRLNPTYINELLNLFQSIRDFSLVAELPTNREVYNKAINLMQQIKTEYHLE